MARKPALKATLSIVNVEGYEDQLIITFSRFIAKRDQETLRGQLDGIVAVTGTTQNVVVVTKSGDSPWTVILPQVKGALVAVFGPLPMDDTMTRECVRLVEDDDLADMREQFEDVALTGDEREALGFDD